MSIFAASFIQSFTQRINSMIWCVIIILVVFACVVIYFLKRKEKKSKLPNSIFDRIGASSVLIQHYFNEKGYASTTKDRSIWNISSFIMAFLVELEVCSVVDRIHIQSKFQHLYKNEDESFACKLWMEEGFYFYRKQIKDMISEKHPLPDVIVYNLLHPDTDKKAYEDLLLFNIDMIVVTDCWNYIDSIIVKFFLSDQDINNLPKV